MTFCPYCGTKILITLSDGAQVTVLHLEPLCAQAAGFFEGLSKAVRRLPMLEDFAGRN